MKESESYFYHKTFILYTRNKEELSNIKQIMDLLLKFIIIIKTLTLQYALRKVFSRGTSEVKGSRKKTLHTLNEAFQKTPLTYRFLRQLKIHSVLFSVSSCVMRSQSKIPVSFLNIFRTPTEFVPLSLLIRIGTLH